jgi:predicted metal-binding protein
MQCDSQQEKIVYFAQNGEKKNLLLKEIRGWAKKYNISEIIPLKTEDICVAHWVRLKCKYGCRKYAKSWCCPPETPTPDQTKALLSEYQKALLLIGTNRNGDFYRENQKKRRIQVNTWKGTVALERRLFLSGYYKALGLVSENCALCKVCAYPGECKFPDDRRPSVESCSIDIFQTLKNIGKPIQIAQNVDAEYNCYSIILLE